MTRLPGHEISSFESTSLSQKIVTPDLIRGPDGYGLPLFRLSPE